MISLRELQTVNLLGINVSKTTMDKVLRLCEEHIAARSSLLVGVLNVAKAVNSRRDNQLRKSLESAHIVLADGRGIVWLSKLIGEPLPERIAGIDLMYRLFDRADKKHYKVYFLGATKEVVKKVADFVRKNHPGLQVVGYKDGYFDESDGETVAEDIRNSLADILFVGVPSPKKENFLSRWQEQMAVPVCHGVGGSFDIVAGITRRAPMCMQKYGFEWFYRVLQEPRRMWKRYLVTNSIFAMLSVVAFVRARVDRLVGRFTQTSSTKSSN